MNNIFIKIKNISIVGKIAISMLLLVSVVAILAPLLAFNSHIEPSGDSLLPPSKVHILGTDDLGIDLWAQMVYGARLSMIIGFSTALFAGLGGSIIGCISGYFGGKIDKVIMRLTDIVIILPELPTMIILGAFFGPSIKNIIIVLSLFSWKKPARITRSKVLSIKNENYIKIAKSYGGGFFYMIKWHFLPYITPVIMVSFIKLINKAIIAEASLAFLGLGDPTSKSWGLILNHAISFKGIYFTDYWKWWLVAPLVAIIFIIIAIAIIGREFESVFKFKM